MKRQSHLYILLSMLALGVAAQPIATLAAPTNLSIPVQGADGVFEADTSAFPYDSQLPATYFPVRASDGTGWFSTVPISGTLRTLIEQIPDSYFPVRASDGVSWVNLEPVSGTLASLLDQIPAYYFPVRSPDGTFLGTFEYPAELLGDTFPPQISNASIDQITGLAEWETDEFATSAIWYGTDFGSYTHVVSSTLWAKGHRFILPGLTGDIQYFLIRGADRSGNLAEYYIPGYSISGNVQDGYGNPIPNVVISVSPTQATLTDDNGDYTLQGIPAGDYVITPCHPQYDFTPESITTTVSEDLTGQDFVGRPYTADFSAAPTSGIAPLTVVFTNTSLGGYTTSLWDFGDELTSTLDGPTHVYWTPGVHTVILTISGPDGSDTMTRTDYITVYDPVEADFTAAPRTGIESATVAFVNTSTGDYDTNLWDFGDGITSTQESPTHIYTRPGAYDVSLTVSGLGGTDTESRPAYINVYQQAVAGFTAFPTEGFAELEVVFVNTSTGDYTTSSWDFGDGGTSTEKHPIHTYTLPGVYTVTLTADGPGGADTCTDRITVYEPVKANFLASPRFGIAPLAVHFVDISEGPVDTWEWAFGDGQTSALQHPVHTYLITGTYTVSLTVRAPAGSAVWPGGTDTLARTGYVTVGVPLYMPIVVRNH
jgi:PKD repeat protein